MTIDTWKLDSFRQNILCYYSNIFSDEEIEKIKNESEKLQENEGETFSLSRDKDESIRKSGVKWIPINENFEWLYRKITDLILHANEKFFRFDLEEIEPLQYTIYREGNFYVPHVDLSFSNRDLNRKLSFTMQLSDSTNYEGGDLFLKIDSKGYTANKEKGSITIFPSYVLHEVTKVTKGERYSLVGWVSGNPFK